VRFFTNPSLFEIINLENSIHHFIGDVRDLSYLEEILSKFSPDFVFHLAAQSLVRLSYEIPVETFQTNMMGTINVLESIRKQNSVKVCIVMTSDKCYENLELDHAFKENEPLGGYDPYSASKSATEIITAAYRNSFFNSKIPREYETNIATVRAGNVIGGGDWQKDRVVPDCIRGLISKKPVQIRNPDSIRPFQYVLEPLSGILCLAMKMWNNPNKFTEAWNFGPILSKKKTTVKELVNLIINRLGDGSWIDVSNQSSNILHESKLLELDSSKAMNSLGWNPVYSIENAVSETVDWYNAYNEHNVDMNEFTLNQIQNYVESAQQMNIVWTN